jgi:hypothetical protein
MSATQQKGIYKKREKGNRRDHEVQKRNAVPAGLLEKKSRGDIYTRKYRELSSQLGNPVGQERNERMRVRLWL